MKTFIVLGMHGSATSLVSEGMAQAGVYMGDPQEMAIATLSSVNTLTWEDSDFKKINRKIIRKAGGTWYNPPQRKAILKAGEHFRGRIKDLIMRERSNRKFWGWKDPRTTLTIECFTPYLTNPHFIACFRDPIKVARSLQRRNGFTIEKGHTLACIYNERLLNFLREWNYKNYSKEI